MSPTESNDLVGFLPIHKFQCIRLCSAGKPEQFLIRHDLNNRLIFFPTVTPCEPKNVMKEKNGSEALYLYKYRDFDKNEGNLKIITEGTLAFSNPVNFNDPFDSSPAYDPLSITEIYKRRPDLIRKVGDSMGLSPAGRIEQKGKLIRNVQRAMESGDWAEALMSRVGILCLSRNPTNALMWSHYANNHRGFLVEFAISPDAGEEELQPLLSHPVEYTQERPLLDWGNPDGNIEPYFLTKSLDWEYEQEERVLDLHRGPGFYKYSREQFLSSVTAGLRIDNEDYRKLRKTVDKASAEIGREIPLYQAKLSPNRYKVYIPGHPCPKASSPE